MKREFSDRDISSTFAKGMAVLRAFDDQHSRLSLADIARATGLDRATVRRLTLTLVHLGYAYRDSKHFSLSPKVLALAGSFLRGHQFGTVVQPLLNACAARTRTPVSLAIVDGGCAMYVAQSTLHDGDVTFGFTVGSKLPLLHTAIGRALLSMGNSSWSGQVVDAAQFDRYTPETLMNRKLIKKQISVGRTQGYAIVCDEFEPGVTGMAVPVNSQGGSKVAVGTSCRSAEVQHQTDQQQIIEHLRQVAQELVRSKIFNDGRRSDKSSIQKSSIQKRGIHKSGVE